MNSEKKRLHNRRSAEKDDRSWCGRRKKNLQHFGLNTRKDARTEERGKRKL